MSENPRTPSEGKGPVQGVPLLFYPKYSSLGLGTPALSSLVDPVDPSAFGPLQVETTESEDLKSREEDGAPPPDTGEQDRDAFDPPATGCPDA